MNDAQITPRMRHAVATLLLGVAAAPAFNILLAACAVSVLRHPERDMPWLADAFGAERASTIVLSAVCLSMLLSAAVLRRCWLSVRRTLRLPTECECGYDLRGSGHRCPECGATHAVRE